MEPVRDNPLSRFTSFWWTLGIFLLVAAGVGVFALFNREAPVDLETEAAKTRYEVRKQVDAAQAAAFKPGALDKGMQQVVEKLAATKPAAVEQPEQIVPGSPRSKALAAAPAPDTAAIDKAPDPAAANAPLDPAAMALGKALYTVCAACHGLDAKGTMAAPPLAGSEWVNGPASNLIRIQMRGLTGPIHVLGKEYNFPAPMAPLNAQTDDQIAAVLTYVRNSFGNKAPAVTADMVKQLRSEVGKPMLTEADLVKPTP